MKTTNTRTFLKLNPMNGYDKMLLFTFILFLVENMYFGWNETAQSRPERFFDAVIMWLLLWNALGSLIISAMRYFANNFYIETERKETTLCGNQHCHCTGTHCTDGHNHR